MASTAKRSNSSIVREAYDAFNEGDIETVLGHMSDGIEWTEPAGGTLGGTYVGPQAVAEGVFGRIAGSFEEFVVDIDRYMDCGGDVVVVGRLRGTSRAGKRLDSPFAHVVELDEGKITSFRNYTDSAAWNEAVADS